LLSEIEESELLIIRSGHSAIMVRSG
jgi:hypothetical protein